MTYFSSDQLHFFNEGTARRLYERLGAHPGTHGGKVGTHFAVWAPGARAVQVIGDFCSWTNQGIPMRPVHDSGIWYAFAPGVEAGCLYKYRIEAQNGSCVDKADPVGFAHEEPPKTASVVTSLDYEWNDAEWMAVRKRKIALDAPVSIYELHLGSWQRTHDDKMLGYRALAPRIIEHCKSLGFTHVELMPITEHPFYGSWGYQVTGYFAATARYGTPQDLMFLIDSLHQAGLGVVLDWVPAHFPTDEHGLGDFDGTHLYEHSDPRKGFHPDWNTYIFNYGRHEVRSFLLSSAIFWLERYHVDALRIDGVASMLYLDYSRDEGEWLPNNDGGRENLEAISLLQELNSAVYRDFPDVQTIAEESTAFPMVSRPVSMGGLGFGMKWDMGWMHDTLEYFSREPVHRSHHQEDLTRRALWAFSENYCLPLSHDEVVHGKGSLLSRMPGDAWQRFANVRLLFGTMYGTPGKKMMFMGMEFGQMREWNHDESLDWDALGGMHEQGVQTLVAALNRLYVDNPPMHALDCAPEGFAWLHTGDHEQCVMAWQRTDKEGAAIIAIANYTPIPRTHYRLGVPSVGTYRRLLDTDATEFGGSGYSEVARAGSETIACHGKEQSIEISLGPLAISFWACD